MIDMKQNARLPRKYRTPIDPIANAYAEKQRLAHTDAEKRELAEVARKLNGLTDAIAGGLRAPGLQHRLDALEARRAQLEQDLATVPTTPVRLHPNLAQVYRRQVERIQDALNEPEIRDEALQILRGLVECVSISPAENGLEVEIVGEIAKMVELGIENNTKRAALDETVTRSVKVVAGTRNHLDLQLSDLLEAVFHT